MGERMKISTAIIKESLYIGFIAYRQIQAAIDKKLREHPNNKDNSDYSILGNKMKADDYTCRLERFLSMYISLYTTSLQLQ